MSKTNPNAPGSPQGSHSASEVGNAKNVANLQTLIITCQGFGSSYNPANSLITTTALQTLYANANAAIEDTAAKNNALSHNINTRRVDFGSIKALATQIMAALLASGADEETMRNAQTLNRKIQGSRASKKIAKKTELLPDSMPDETDKHITPIIPPPVEPNTISVSQQSFDNLVDHLSALVNYVSLYTAYNPNEAALKVTALNATVAALTVANNNVKTAQVALNNSRINRTAILYDPKTGLVQITKEVKSYVKSVFTASGTQYKQVAAIPFRQEPRAGHRKHLKK